MDLQTFIEQSLIEIARGIKAAGTELKAEGAIISPKNIMLADESYAAYGVLAKDNEAQNRRPVEAITFDVAVYASEDKETKGGIGILVGFVGLGS